MKKEKCPENIQGYKSLKRLAKDVSNLSYRSVYIFLLCLATELLRTSVRDKEKNRFKLAKKLNRVASSLNEAGREMGEIWDICEKFTEEIQEK